jgi:DNA-directed RNA polymerase specialized sigma24 family protein
MSTVEFSNEIIGLQRTLSAFTRRFTTDTDESLDLIQDTILKALKSRHRFTADTNLKGWLFTIMRNFY